MLKENDIITVHFINNWNHKKPQEVKTELTGKTFEVKIESRKLGFDGNVNRSPYTCRGELFTPFAAYAWSVIFRNEKTKQLYRYSSIKEDLEEVTGLKDGYVDQITFIA